MGFFFPCFAFFLISHYQAVALEVFLIVTENERERRLV